MNQHVRHHGKIPLPDTELKGQDVDDLIRNMEQSVAESEAFIRRFREGR